MISPGRAALALATVLVVSSTSARADTRPVTLDVDAREAPRRIFHARLVIPASPGPLALAYPKWIPGEHGPTGPIADLAGLKFSAGGRTLAWSRDGEDMYLFRVDVPAGTEAVEAQLDYLSPADAGGFSSGSSATGQLAVVSWNAVPLYPADARPDEILYSASLTLPEGWKWASALEAAPEAGGRLRFRIASLTELVDSPVLAGSHFRVVTLIGESPVHRLDIAADSDEALEMSSELEKDYRALVSETGALFGARHYRHYDFLLTLSDHTAHFGLEHHESSDDRVDERSLVDADRRRLMAGLLPHEMTHSWNGKSRRPADLAAGRFSVPMKGDLLWVYEGLTEYLGQVLTARSGLLTAELYRESLALTAAEMDHQKGRSWRPLQDTAVAAQILYGARSDWAAWRRGVDFYPESELLWLEADALIRDKTGGRRSLDDFCRSFLGGASGPPTVVSYTFEDVMAALGAVAAEDWKTFWRTRLDRTSEGAPLAGIEASGWKLVYTEEIPEMQRSAEEARKTTDVRYSIGISVDSEGTIPDTIPGSPAALAGVGPGMRLVAVNGRRWTRENLRDAIRRSASHPIELLVENADFFRTVHLNYSGRERYPHLERDSSRPDLLSKIIAPRSATGGKARPAR